MYSLIWLRSFVKRFIDTQKPNMLLICTQPNLIQFIDTILSDLYTRINIDMEHRLNTRDTSTAKSYVPIVSVRDVDHLCKTIIIQISSIIRNMLKLIHISKIISQQLSFDSQDFMENFEMLISSYREALSFLPSEFQLNFLPEFDVIPVFDIPKQTNLSLKIYLSEKRAERNDVIIQNLSGTNIHLLPYPIIIQMIKELNSDQSIFVSNENSTKSIQLNMDSFRQLIEKETLDYNAIRPYMIAIVDALNGRTTSNSVTLVNEIYSRLLTYYVAGGTRVSPYRDFHKENIKITNESHIFLIIQLMQYGPLIVKNFN